MSDLVGVLPAASTLAYDTFLNDTLTVRSWAAYLGRVSERDVSHTAGSFGALRFAFWQEVLHTALAGKGREKTRLYAELLCHPDYSPMRYTLYVDGARVAIEFTSDAFRAELPDGSPVEGSSESADFLLAGNMVPQLALKVKLLHASGRPAGYEGAFFSPDSLQVVPYTLRWTDGGIVSSFGESIAVDREGWIEELSIPAHAIQVRRRNRPVPRWKPAAPGSPQSGRRHAMCPHRIWVFA